MASTIELYSDFVDNLASGNIDWLNDTVKVALVASSYSPNKHNDVWADVSTHEVTGTGYTAGGETLTTKTQTYDSATGVRSFDADDVEWNNSTITARYAVIYSDQATNLVIAYVDFGAERASSEGLFRIAWHADGIFEAVI